VAQEAVIRAGTIQLLTHARYSPTGLMEVDGADVVAEGLSSSAESVLVLASIFSSVGDVEDKRSRSRDPSFQSSTQVLEWTWDIGWSDSVSSRLGD
jgi:hypothetical protein